jgi:ATP-binding cassette subfamily B protein
MKLPLPLTVAGPAVRAHIPALSVAAGLIVLQVGVVLLFPWPLALAIDHALDGKPLTGLLEPLAGTDPKTLLVLAAISTVALSALAGLLDWASIRISEGAAQRIGATLRSAVFERTMTRSLRWHDRMRTGELISRLTTDVGRMLDGITAIATTLLPDALTLLGVLVLLLAFDPVLALVGLTVIPLLGALAVRQRRRIRAVQQVARTESGRLAGSATDLFRNVRAVQAFGRTDRATEVFGAQNQAVLDVQLRGVDVYARWVPVADVVLAIGSALVLVFGGRRVLDGAISTGELLVVLSYLSSLYAPVRGLTRLSAVLAKSRVSAERVQEVLDCPEAVVDRPNAVPAPKLVRDVRFDDVAFSYEPGHPVLSNFNLRIAAGETVCLFGPNGLGKSTLLHLLLRLYDVDAGRVSIDGVDIRDLQQRSLRERFAFVPQDPWLLDATVAENIAFGNQYATRDDVIEAGRAAQVDEFIDRLPDGYDTSLGESGVRLSGGQRRRVAIARAAISPAPMVLMDEPTASLDSRSAAGVVEAIRTTTAHRTVLLVTHDSDLAAIADRVVTLDRVLASGGARRIDHPDLPTGGDLQHLGRR